MKYTKIALLVLAVIAWFGTVQHSQAELARRITLRTLTLTLPDTTVLAFQWGRNTLMSNLLAGGGITTTSRISAPYALEPKGAFEAGDFAVGTNKQWRGKFNPSGAFIDQVGSRVYGSFLAVGEDGKIRLSDLSYEVLCGISALNNSSSFASSTYAISRIGILAGPDGILFTADDIIVMSGSASIEVDAIVFIGARLGALVNTPLDMQVLNSAIGTNGTYATFRYTFGNSTRTNVSQTTVNIYQTGAISTNYNRLSYMRMPKGLFCFVEGWENSGPVTLKSRRIVSEPFSTVTDQAWEGNSVFIPFTGSETNDAGFVSIVDERTTVPMSFDPSSTSIEYKTSGIVKRAISGDADQDSQ